jgi:hypothetical protein
MSVYMPASAEIAREARLVNHPHWHEERGPIVEPVDRVQRAREDHDFRDTQAALLTRIKGRQTMVGETRTALEHARRERAQAAAERPKPVDRLRELQRRVETLTEHRGNMRAADGGSRAARPSRQTPMQNQIERPSAMLGDR